MVDATQAEHIALRNELLSSLLEFTRTFYLLRTGRKFELSKPLGRESHYISICRALVKVITGETKRLIINVPPRHAKTELLIHFVSWAMAQFPDSNFIYVSYSLSLAKRQTQTIRQIMQMPQYRDIFDVNLKEDSAAKDNFETTDNGSVYAAGAAGTITGRGCGIKGAMRFGGAFLMDDMHKPDEVNSDKVREGVIEWFYNTAQSRLNDRDTPIIFIGQRLHEADLPAHLISTGDWETLILPALDKAGNALNPEMHDVKALLKMKEENPYVYAAQYQQDPQPAGGGIFKPEWFYLTEPEQEPEILATFITADTAETDKSYNDATVFSFFGIYKIFHGDIETDTYGLHWINCIEIRVEPKDLESEFMAFYAGCMRYKVKPMIAAIEKKSTGVTLLSVLKKVRGLRLIEIERTKSSGSKTTRFLEIQPIVASRYISLPEDGKHTQMCLEHMRKISANDSHRHDDICDTLTDAIKLALIDRVIINSLAVKPQYDKAAQIVMGNFNKITQLKQLRNSY